MVSDRILISIHSVSVEALEILCAEAVDALAPSVGDLKPDDLQSPFKKLKIYPKSSSAFPLFLLKPDQTWIV